MTPKLPRRPFSAHPFSAYEEITHIHADTLGIPVETVVFLHDEGEGLDQRNRQQPANGNDAASPIKGSFNALMQASLGVFVAMDRLANTPHAQTGDVAGFFAAATPVGQRFFNDILAAPDQPAEDKPAMLVLSAAHLIARSYARKLVFGPALERNCEPLAEFARVTVPGLMHNPPQPPEQPLERLFVLHFMRAAIPAVEKALTDYGHEGMAHVAHVLSRQSQAQFCAHVQAAEARKQSAADMLASLPFLTRKL